MRLNNIRKNSMKLKVVNLEVTSSKNGCTANAIKTMFKMQHGASCKILGKNVHLEYNLCGGRKIGKRQIKCVQNKTQPMLSNSEMSVVRFFLRLYHWHSGDKNPNVDPYGSYNLKYFFFNLIYQRKIVSRNFSITHLLLRNITDNFDFFLLNEQLMDYATSL